MKYEYHKVEFEKNLILELRVLKHACITTLPCGVFFFFSVHLGQKQKSLSTMKRSSTEKGQQ